MGLKIAGQIEKVNGKELSYREFVERYMEKNQPVVLTGLMDDWRACKDWVTLNGQPNLQFFTTHFGKSRVQVADCGGREFTDQKRVELSVSEFVDQWREDSVPEGRNGSTHVVRGKPLLYLKDWHFVKEYPEYIAYTTPLFFCDDWLNLYLDNYRMHKDPDIYSGNNEISCSDYRFVYMGAKGTWTPLHADVFRSYSWSANVCGKKRWFFLSPSHSHLVFDRNKKSCVYNIFDDVDETKFPSFNKVIWLECIQEQNEIIFVPSGWYHQVHNLEDTISINHNWFNGYNLFWVWDLLLRDYNEAKEYIEDIKDICDDFEGLCQRNLAANTGMNFYDFLIFLAHMSLANLVHLCKVFRGTENCVWSLSPMAQQLTFNLTSIQKIALKMKATEELTRNYRFHLDFRDTLDDPEFGKLCSVLGRTYEQIHKQQRFDCQTKEGSINAIRDLNIIGTCTSQDCTNPEDLVKFIDHAIVYLRGIYGEENV
ncbi:arginine-specific demethylase JMJ20 isoform X1 [Ziziphus jujuba]|uniref:Arginine-specific demethylase JMJ20 isoform X1 n=1 Tax=Ziziphus jujuba TaxID=326968 RepID=A0A6P3ZST6_ZIZJJ|nr:arginine-specific demethylase JMJ20 isoform X1 [Ziziphus jujuba]